ncbi:mitochondrial ribosomal protein S25 [Lasiosphaeria hispida]|uniref:37S ribosomal protein S25, mitochondrial n=1 Tax=Lasiosphaeria hispida TaxID=260671 RepID=A0AAJ0H9J1_9PEZI|nr:mitochondrial ribosomal protein S25 [Lasiosphaeria hispida]
MGRHFRPARVAQATMELMAANLVHDTPRWYKAVKMIPPAEILTRPYPVQHTAPSPHARRPRNLFKPTHMVYPEDELRRNFFRDHPWELARPRMILELDGKDARYVDWSTGVRQPGMPLSGECVVQRQLWLMENVPDVTKESAYDMARREFYELRQLEDIQRRIAVEEARMVGAYFGKSTLQYGMDIEDKEYERWKKWAGAEINKMEAERQKAYTNVVDLPDTPDLEEELLKEAL